MAERSQSNARTRLIPPLPLPLLLLLFPHADTPIPVNLHLIDSGTLTLRSASTKHREIGTVRLWNWDWCEAGGGW
ncbi:hypothetical protein EDB80DRAFT_716878 [Ilyonectria destructans]|nr:hypothetical protein EDB80DRAFT_716878 [Ilyonectria destructans]